LNEDGLNCKTMSGYDKRERIYCREQINPDNLVFLSQSSNFSTQKQVWIYTLASAENQSHSKDVPIVQSYVDVFLRDCIQIEEKYKISNFANDCIVSAKKMFGEYAIY
jgi:hypothetical protein